MTLEGWGRLAETIRRRDWTGAAMLVSRPLGIVRFDRMLILVTSPTAERHSLWRVRDQQPGLAARQAGPDDLPSLQRVFPHSASKYAGRFERGLECLIVEQAGAPVAMGWFGSDREAPMELGCRIHLPEGGWWGYDTFVLMEHRGRGAFAVLMREMFARLAASGCTRFYAAVSHLNTASLVAHRRIGYSTAAVLDRLLLAGRARHRVTLPDGERIRLDSPGGGPPVLPIP